MQILNQCDHLHGIWLVILWKFAICKFSITCFKNYRARYSCAAPHVNNSSNWSNEKRSLNGGNFKVGTPVSGNFREENVIRELILHWSFHSQRDQMCKESTIFIIATTRRSMCHVPGRLKITIIWSGKLPQWQYFLNVFNIWPLVCHWVCYPLWIEKQ